MSSASLSRSSTVICAMRMTSASRECSAHALLCGYNGYESGCTITFIIVPPMSTARKTPRKRHPSFARPSRPSCPPPWHQPRHAPPRHAAVSTVAARRAEGASDHVDETACRTGLAAVAGVVVAAADSAVAKAAAARGAGVAGRTAAAVEPNGRTQLRRQHGAKDSDSGGSECRRTPKPTQIRPLRGCQITGRRTIRAFGST